MTETLHGTARRSVALSSLLLVTLLQACGGGGGGGGGTGNAAGTSAAAATTSGGSGVSSVTSSSASAANSTGGATGTSTATGSGATTTAPATSGSGTATPTTTGSGTGGSGSGSGTATLSVRVHGNRFVDANGSPLSFRGVNVSGLEFVSVGGWSPANPWGGQTGTATPDWNAIKTWGVNLVRLPLNESSWLGASCLDSGGNRGTVGAMVNPDPGANYRATVAQAVSAATAAGLYVILDLHWTAPGNNCAMAQNPMADSGNAIPFWTQLATAFKTSPNVMFEVFNEPFLYALGSGETAWPVLLDGGTITQFITGGTPYAQSVNWSSAGMQQLVDAIRATGAANVILTSGQSYTQDLSQWLSYRPSDPLGQLAATWHAYPAYGTVFGSPAYALPNYGDSAYAWASAIMAAGIPVLITEFGDQNSAGTPSAPFAANLLPWADRNNVSYVGWAWDVWANSANVLITDAAGDPTPGFGVYVKAHYLCRAAGTVTCS